MKSKNCYYYYGRLILLVSPENHRQTETCNRHKQAYKRGIACILPVQDLWMNVVTLQPHSLSTHLPPTYPASVLSRFR